MQKTLDTDDNSTVEEQFSGVDNDVNILLENDTYVFDDGECLFQDDSTLHVLNTNDTFVAKSNTESKCHEMYIPEVEFCYVKHNNMCDLLYNQGNLAKIYDTAYQVNPSPIKPQILEKWLKYY